MKSELLTAIAAKNLKTPGFYTDGKGLYLQITETGLKSWVFRFMLNGRRRDMGLGRFGLKDNREDSLISLATARSLAAEARNLVKDGIDPIEQRKAVKLAAIQATKVETAKTITFRECAEAYIRAHSPGWKNDKHRAQWPSTLKMYAYPVFGDLAPAEIDTGLVLKVLEPIWTTKTETASRLRGRIEVVLDWAKTREYRDGENPARWKGHLDKMLAPRSKVQKVKHHAALPYDEIGGFMALLRSQEGFSAKGLEFQILTATRPGEAMGATWTEIDLAKKVWTIPAERMKAEAEHRVPLSEAAITLLSDIPRVDGNDFVFPGSKSQKPISDMAFLQLLKRMGHGDLTAHGFRSTFRDWCAERTAYPHEVCEMALAHTVSNKVEAAYRRGDLFEKRIRLMQDWADFCDTSFSNAGDNVTNLRTA